MVLLGYYGKAYFSDHFTKGKAIIAPRYKNTNVKKTKVNGYEAIFFSNDSVNILQYNTNEYIYELNSDALTEKELKKIAENLESLEKLVVN